MGLKHLSENDIGNLVAKQGYQRKSINSLDDLPAASGGKIDLLAGYHYDWNAIVNIGTDYINIPAGTSVSFKGKSANTAGILYTGTGGAIRTVDSNLTIENFQVVTPTAGGKAFDFQNAARDKNIFLNKCNIGGQDTLSMIDGFNVQYIGTVNFGSTSNGIQVKNGRYLYLKDLGFDATNTGTFIDIPSGSYEAGQIVGGIQNVGVGVTGINLNSATTFAGICLIQGVGFTGVGTYVAGHDPHTYYDVEYVGNGQLADTVPAASYYWGNNANTYTQLGNGYSKIEGGTSIANNLFRFSHTSPNRVDYLGKQPIKIIMTIACTLDYNSGSGYIGDIAVFKSGVYQPASVNGLSVYSTEEPVSTSVQLNLVQGDYLEVFSYKYGSGNQTVKATFLNSQIVKI